MPTILSRDSGVGPTVTVSPSENCESDPWSVMFARHFSGWWTLVRSICSTFAVSTFSPLCESGTSAAWSRSWISRAS
ncbi:hypothetical protein [Halovenus salina]|uniref:hypothetical protein n=1 Tax=Halovenus salina TaxID=1510225 RepID=UPI0036D3FEE1